LSAEEYEKNRQRILRALSIIRRERERIAKLEMALREIQDNMWTHPHVKAIARAALEKKP